VVYGTGHSGINIPSFQTNVVSISRVRIVIYLENGSRRLFQNVGKFLPDHTASHHKDTILHAQCKSNVVSVHGIKSHRGGRGTAPLILTHALNGGERSASHPGRFTPGKQSPDAIKYDAAAAPETVSMFSCLESNPGPIPASLVTIPTELSRVFTRWVITLIRDTVLQTHTRGRWNIKEKEDNKMSLVSNVAHHKMSLPEDWSSSSRQKNRHERLRRALNNQRLVYRHSNVTDSRIVLYYEPIVESIAFSRTERSG
jgi:hypothetical protein